ncbi:MAG: hypothetical protein ACXWCZ_13195 [Flavisolibacter sp.]
MERDYHPPLQKSTFHVLKRVYKKLLSLFFFAVLTTVCSAQPDSILRLIHSINTEANLDKRIDLGNQLFFNTADVNPVLDMQVAQLLLIQSQENGIATENAEKEEERKANTQYAAIAVVLILFITAFLLLSRSIIVNEKWISFLGVLGLLIVFEFINLFFHPFIASVTNHSPILMLIMLVGIAALLIPAHHKLEHWIKHKMVEKNKRIRLAAAKRTIEKLEK